MPALLDPKNDFVFKRLFANAPHLLADLINAVRSGEAPVQVVEVLNPRIEAAELSGKFIVLDVLARDTAGCLFNIEMQVRRHADWPLRSAYYLARTLANQLQGGDAYAELQPVIGIHLMDFELFVQDQSHWRFELRDHHHTEVVLTPSLQLHLIELPKADRLLQGSRPADATPALAHWVAYFEHWQEDTIMNAITHEPIRQALQHLQDLSADEEARRLAFVRERALRDEKSELRAARQEGRQEGIQIGESRGRAALLAHLLQLKFGPLAEATQQRLQQANEAQLDAWAERILSAPSLADVFA